jgi:hypothetical protein
MCVTMVGGGNSLQMAINLTGIDKVGSVLLGQLCEAATLPQIGTYNGKGKK